MTRLARHAKTRVARAQAVEAALAEKRARLARTRLAKECARLDPSEERRVADEAWGADHPWPEY